MKTSLVAALFCISSVFYSCQSGTTRPDKGDTTKDSVTVGVKVLTDKIRFCESTYPYKNAMLIANFGTEQLNPLNTEGKGYILAYAGDQTSVFIPADGNLSAPKGMYEKNGYLFICDVNKIVVYNTLKLDDDPQVIRFPADDLFINDMAAAGDSLFVSVTNTGRIYRLNIGDLAALNKVKPEPWCHVPGANGMVMDGRSMYIASYPPDGNTTGENVVYCISDITKPIAEKWISQSGQYDGIALSPDGKTIYVSNWLPAGVIAIDKQTKAITNLNVGDGLVGPADMTLKDGLLYIPDLPNSRVVLYPL